VSRFIMASFFEALVAGAFVLTTSTYSTKPVVDIYFFSSIRLLLLFKL
jgi:hypothetical protein